MTDVKIDHTQISRVQMCSLCRTILMGMDRFYSNPENLRRYEAWLRNSESSDRFHDGGAQTSEPWF